jgi:hypothetical protein
LIGFAIKTIEISQLILENFKLDLVVYREPIVRPPLMSKSELLLASGRNKHVSYVQILSN